MESEAERWRRRHPVTPYSEALVPSPDAGAGTVICPSTDDGPPSMNCPEPSVPRGEQIVKRCGRAHSRTQVVELAAHWRSMRWTKWSTGWRTSSRTGTAAASSRFVRVLLARRQTRTRSFSWPPGRKEVETAKANS